NKAKASVVKVKAVAKKAPVSVVVKPKTTANKAKASIVKEKPEVRKVPASVVVNTKSWQELIDAMGLAGSEPLRNADIEESLDEDITFFVSTEAYIAKTQKLVEAQIKLKAKD